MKLVLGAEFHHCLSDANCMEFAFEVELLRASLTESERGRNGGNYSKSTFRFSSRDMRLTGVHGHIIKEILV
jgi:hypothetical protein